MNTLEGMRLAAMFAYSAKCAIPANKQVLEEYIRGGQPAGIEKALYAYGTMITYLELIAERFKSNKIFEMARPYWMGGEELGSFRPDDYSKLEQKLKSRGSWIPKEKPQQFIPLHLTKVMMDMQMFKELGVSKPGHLNDCMIRSGQVLQTGDRELTLESWKLEEEGGKYKFGTMEEKVIYRPEWVKAEKGDRVAIHKKTAVMLLEEEEVKELEKWTRKVAGI